MGINVRLSSHRRLCFIYSSTCGEGSALHDTT